MTKAQIRLRAICIIAVAFALIVILVPIAWMVGFASLAQFARVFGDAAAHRFGNTFAWTTNLLVWVAASFLVVRKAVHLIERQPIEPE